MKIKQTGKERSSVTTWEMGQGGVVTTQCTFPDAWRKKSKLKLVSVLAYAELLATMHRKEH